MPTFLRINPHLRINLDNVTFIREAGLNETYQVLDDSRPGPVVKRAVNIPSGAAVVEFVGKKVPLVLTGPEAGQLENFLDGRSDTLSHSGGDDDNTGGTAALTAAMRGERDFGALTAPHG